MKHFAVLPFLMMSTAALAQATPQGAADLTAVFQTYLGKTTGVVSVTADGDAYAITLNAGPLIAMIPAEAGAAMTATPIQMRATDNGDGTWAVSQNQSLGFTTSVAGALDMQVTVGSIVCNGTYSAALKAFAQNDCTLTDLAVDQTVTDPQGGSQVTKQTVKELTLASTSTAGANGGVDGTIAYTGTGIAQSMQVPTEPGAPPLPIEITADSYQTTATTRGVRMDAILSAVAWAVENPSQEMMTAKKGELKTILQGGLPLFELIDATGTATNLNIVTPVGPVGIASLGFDVTMKGAVADGQFREALRFSGITPPPGVLPPFAEPLLPQRFSVDFGVQSFDASAAASVLLGLFDLAPGTGPGPEFQGQLLQALMPDGSVDILLAPGEVANDLYSLQYQGSMTAGPMSQPVGKATVTMVGLADVMAALDGAPQEVKDQVLPILGVAQGLAKPGTDGALLWEIDASTPGSLLVNGMDLMGMQ